MKGDSSDKFSVATRRPASVDANELNINIQRVTINRSLLDRGSSTEPYKQNNSAIKFHPDPIT